MSQNEIYNRLYTTEEKTSKLKCIAIRTERNSIEREKKDKINSISDMWGNIKHSNFFFFGNFSPRRKESAKYLEKY